MGKDAYLFALSAPRPSMLVNCAVHKLNLILLPELTEFNWNEPKPNPLLSSHLLPSADSEEHDALAQALVLIRETISAVDSQVHDYERASWLRDIGRSLEPHSRGRLKDGRVFKREDLAVGSRNLLHEGTVNWQAANRWLKGDLKINSQIQN